MRLVWLSIDAPNMNIGQSAARTLKTCLSFLPLKKYSSSVSLPVSFSNSNSFCFIWSLMKYKSMISITFWINLILFKISANQKIKWKRKFLFDVISKRSLLNWNYTLRGHLPRKDFIIAKFTPIFLENFRLNFDVGNGWWRSNLMMTSLRCRWH